jgi:putative redox protein
MGEGLRFAATDAYGHSIAIEAPEADGGDFDCFKPGAMLLTSLAGCSGIDVVGILRKQRQDVTAIEIKVSGVQEPDPPWTWTPTEWRARYISRRLRTAR